MTNLLHYSDLDRCRKLTEIGFPETENYFDSHCLPQYQTEKGFGITTDGEYVCPSVMEMLDVIPSTIKPRNELYSLAIQRNSPKSEQYLVSYVKDYGMHCHFLGTLPNALADLILWLHENKYITFKPL